MPLGVLATLSIIWVADSFASLEQVLGVAKQNRRFKSPNLVIKSSLVTRIGASFPAKLTIFGMSVSK